MEPWQVPKGVDGSDIDCAEFWDDNCKGYLIGKGDTIQEAVDNLKSKLDASIYAFNIDKYLFLDFDGVLNTGRYAKLMAREGIDPFDEFGAIFDSEAVANLKHIVKQMPASIASGSISRNNSIFFISN